MRKDWCLGSRKSKQRGSIHAGEGLAFKVLGLGHFKRREVYKGIPCLHGQCIIQQPPVWQQYLGKRLCKLPEEAYVNLLLCHGSALEIQSRARANPWPRSFRGQEPHHVDLKSRAPKSLLHARSISVRNMRLFECHRVVLHKTTFQTKPTPGLEPEILGSLKTLILVSPQTC